MRTLMLIVLTSPMRRPSRCSRSASPAGTDAVSVASACRLVITWSNGTHVAFAAEQLADDFDPNPFDSDDTFWEPYVGRRHHHPRRPPGARSARRCATGEHIVEVTVSDGGAEDFEVVTITVEEAVLTADLQVVVTPDIAQQTMVGDAVAYTASVHNAGPDPVAADLTIQLEHRPQAEWGSVPPEAAINGVFFLGARRDRVRAQRFRSRSRSSTTPSAPRRSSRA